MLLTNDAKVALEEWLEERGKVEGLEGISALFITKKIKRMTESDVRRLFEHASGKTVTPHMMRHFYGTVAAKVGGVAFAHQQLGHTSMTTTINNYANGSYGMRDILACM